MFLSTIQASRWANRERLEIPKRLPLALVARRGAGILTLRLHQGRCCGRKVIAITRESRHGSLLVFVVNEIVITPKPEIAFRQDLNTD